MTHRRRWPGSSISISTISAPFRAPSLRAAPPGSGGARRARRGKAHSAATRPRLDNLAQRIEPKATWDDIVLLPNESKLLHQIADQVANRTQVYQDWGFEKKTSRGLGINALFAGDSGTTGKTMAAEVLANHLKLHVYRIDLSAVVSKYIGETEKNLRRLFDAAEDGGAILFFDEADALFGKRTEVKDSHDRYANIEINYLLQRMESYGGLAILATNMKSTLDQAFLRRLRFIVDFHFPGAGERKAIWQKVFPKDVPLRRPRFRPAGAAEPHRRTDFAHRAERGLRGGGRQGQGHHAHRARLRAQRIPQAGASRPRTRFPLAADGRLARSGREDRAPYRAAGGGWGFFRRAVHGKRIGAAVTCANSERPVPRGRPRRASGGGRCDAATRRAANPHRTARAARGDRQEDRGCHSCEHRHARPQTRWTDMTTFPGSPVVLQAGIVLLDPDSFAILPGGVIALQYNPDSLTRTLKVKGISEGGDRSEALRLTGPAEETFKLDAEIDATDQLEFPDTNANAVQYGIFPQLAGALETLVYPASSTLQMNFALSQAGTLEIMPMMAPMCAVRVEPQSHRAGAHHRLQHHRRSLRSAAQSDARESEPGDARAFSIDDLYFGDKGGGLYMAYQRQKEMLAQLFQRGTLGSLGLEGVAMTSAPQFDRARPRAGNACAGAAQEHVVLLDQPLLRHRH